MPAAGQRAHINRPQLMVDLQDGFGGHHVLAHQAHMLPGRDRGIDQQRLLIGLIDIFDHDDGVGILGQRVAGVDRVDVFTQAQCQRLRLPRRRRGGCIDRIAIHRGTMIMRR